MTDYGFDPVNDPDMGHSSLDKRYRHSCEEQHRDSEVVILGCVIPSMIPRLLKARSKLKECRRRGKLV
jgi:hypothetical protein